MEDISFFPKHTYVVSEVCFIVCIYSTSPFFAPQLVHFLLIISGVRGIITLIWVQMSLVLFCHQLEKSGFIKLFKGNGGENTMAKKHDNFSTDNVAGRILMKRIKRVLSVC